MSWVKAISESIAKKAVDDFMASPRFAGLIDGMIRDVLAKPEFAWFRFVKHIQAELQRVDCSLPDKRAFYMARDTYLAFLKDEKVEFGHPDYAWDAAGAREIAHAYEIDHWEVKA